MKRSNANEEKRYTLTAVVIEGESERGACRRAFADRTFKAFSFMQGDVRLFLFTLHTR